METDENDPAFIEDLKHLVRGLGYDAIDTRGMSASRLKQLVSFLIALDSIRKQNQQTLMDEGEEEEEVVGEEGGGEHTEEMTDVQMSGEDAEKQEVKDEEE